MTSISQRGTPGGSGLDAGYPGPIGWGELHGGLDRRGKRAWRWEEGEGGSGGRGYIYIYIYIYIYTYIYPHTYIFESAMYIHVYIADLYCTAETNTAL